MYPRSGLKVTPLLFNLTHSTTMRVRFSLKPAHLQSPVSRLATVRILVYTWKDNALFLRFCSHTLCLGIRGHRFSELTRRPDLFRRRNRKLTPLPVTLRDAVNVPRPTYVSVGLLIVLEYAPVTAMEEQRWGDGRVNSFFGGGAIQSTLYLRRYPT